MKKALISTTALSAAALLVLSGCSGESKSESSEAKGGSDKAPAALKQDGVLSSCIDPEYPPLEYYEGGSDGEIIGFDADAARAIGDLWGVKTKFVVTSFDGLMPGLQAGNCDILLSGLYETEERAQVADSTSIMETGSAILVRPEDTDKFKTKMDLCGVKVASQAASSNAKTINELSEECKKAGKDAIKAVEYPKTAETVLAVLNGKAEVLIETNVAAAYMETQNEGKLKVVNTVFEPDTTFGVFTEKGSELMPDLEAALKELHSNGKLKELAEKYNLDPAILDVH